MGWLDTMTPKPGGSRHCSDDYMYMVHGAYVVAEADDKTVYFSAKYSSKCYNGIPLSRQKSENSSEMRGN
ncbi:MULTISPECIES: hypothetical protein [Mitsuokella]|jgi:imidazoleglycerol phosphate synthase glutamine amidotransferase subunit HisH|uniref:hypothetical protein n=1 Tax=Mitsuokella TaxID=52225 RepID=UPI0005611BB8|nr:MULTISPECIES: hypothetical protein [Mitsuokella]MCQ1532473.1 hypothetical protein [Mitsuokella jalaludinii]